jgi:hypothetical protein
MIIVLPASTSNGSNALLLKKGSMNGHIYFLIIAGPNKYFVLENVVVSKQT